MKKFIRKWLLKWRKPKSESKRLFHRPHSNSKTFHSRQLVTLNDFMWHHAAKKGYQSGMLCHQTSEIRKLCSSNVKKSTSRWVTSPTSRPPISPVSVTGIPENPNDVFAPATSATVWSGDITTGLTIKPCLYFCGISRHAEFPSINQRTSASVKK